MIRSLLIGCGMLLLLTVDSPAQKLNKEPAADYSGYLSAPGFVRNAGQFTNEKNEFVKSILYGTHIGSCGIFITDKGLSYINYSIKNKKPGTGINAGKFKAAADTTYDIERIDITLLGASITIENTQKITPGADHVAYNFYTPSSKAGITGVHACTEITVKNVYPGIDWLIQLVTDRSGSASLKYNFIVQPGADAGTIKLRYSKNVQLTVNNEGGLVAHARLTDFTEKAPVSYVAETHEAVQFRYMVKRQTVTFEGEKKRFNKTVVINPEVYWATYLPSTRPDLINLSIRGEDMATDADLNIYVSLYTSRLIPFITVNPGNGAYYQDYAATAGAAMVIMKFIKTAGYCGPPTFQARARRMVHF